LSAMFCDFLRLRAQRKNSVEMRKNSTPLKRRAFFARLLTNLTFHKKSFYSRRETTPFKGERIEKVGKEHQRRCE
jgi:hypothetical protein